MARPLRINLPGCYFHIYARGNQRNRIYCCESDYRYFLRLLDKCQRKYSIAFYAYALMGNHYHLLLKINLPNLDKAMHFLNGTYTSYFNKTHQRVGHLFQGRYESSLVDADSYMLVLVRYIHLNPVGAGLAPHPAEYPWSSYRAYLGQEHISWLDTGFVLNIFSGSPDVDRARELLRDYVEVNMEQKLKEDPFRDRAHRCILGSKEFISKTRSWIRSTGIQSEAPEIVDHKRIIGLEPASVLEAVRGFYSPSPDGEEIFRWNRPNEAAQVATYLLRELTGLTLREIAQMCGGGHYSRIAQLSKRFEAKLKGAPDLHERVSKIESALSNVKG